MSLGVSEGGAAQTCLICGSARKRAVFHEWGTDSLRCSDCGHVYSAWDADPAYQGYWDNKIGAPDVGFWRDAHADMYGEFFRRMIVEPKGRLLDVGCGFGFFVEAMAGRHPGWEVHGCEISPDAARYARETLGLAHIHVGRVEDAGFPPGSFDMVTLWDVLEHLKHPDPLLAHVHALLAPGGTLFLHTPNVQLQLPKARLRRLLHGMKPDRPYLEVKDHLHLYSPPTLRRLLERNGFRDLRFLHLPPIQHADGLPAPFGRLVKNAWAGGVRVLHAFSGGAVNLDNLFVAARA